MEPVVTPTVTPDCQEQIDLIRRDKVLLTLWLENLKMEELQKFQKYNKMVNNLDSDMLFKIYPMFYDNVLKLKLNLPKETREYLGINIDDTFDDTYYNKIMENIDI